MKIIELTIDEKNSTSKFEAISLVEEPAIEINFVALSKKPKIRFEKLSTVVAGDKQLLFGPFMTPNKMILRKEPDGTLYQVYFSKDTVEKCSQLYMRNSQQFSLDHENYISDVKIVENWIVRNPEMDTSSHFGFSNLPQGTWFGGVKIENKDIWNRIKTGELKGFSIEGFFVENMSKICMEQEITDEYILNEVKKIYNSNINELEKINKLKKIIN